MAIKYKLDENGDYALDSNGDYIEDTIPSLSGASVVRGAVQTSKSGKQGRVDTTTSAKVAIPELNKPAVDGAIADTSKGYPTAEELDAQHHFPTAGERIGDVYQGIRSILGMAPAGIAGIVKGTVAAAKADEGNRAQAFSDSANAVISRTRDAAEKGEGVPGFLADPMNLAMFVPGLGQAKFAEKAPAIIKYAVAPAIENAALTAASGAVDPTKQFDKGDVGISGVLGAGLGLAGRGIQKLAVSNFPGLKKATKASLAQSNTSLNKVEQAEKNKVEKMLKEVKGLGTRSSYEDLADKYRMSSHDEYERIFNKLEPRSNEDANIFDRLLNHDITESNSPPTQEVSDVVKKSLNSYQKELGLTNSEIEKIHDDFMDRLLDNSAGGSNTPKVTPREIQHAKRWLNGDIYNSRASDMAVTKRQSAKAIKEGLDDALYEVVKNREGEEVANGIFNKAKSDYKEYKTIDDYLEKHGVGDGSSWRLGGDGIAKYIRTGGVYLPQTTQYRLGGLLQRGLPAALLPQTKADTTKTKKK